MKIQKKTFSLFLLLLFFSISKASDLSCWATVNTTLEASKAKLVGLIISTNEVLAAYNTTLIKKWQFQTGFYSSEFLLNNSNHSLSTFQSIPDSEKILLIYDDRKIEIRDASQNWKLETNFVLENPFVKILPIPNTNFFYILKEFFIEKRTMGGEILSTMQEQMKKNFKNKKVFKDLISIPNTDLIISISNENNFQIWDIKYDKYKKEIKPSITQDENISCLAYSLAMDALIIGTTKGKIKIYDYILERQRFANINAFNNSVVFLRVFNQYIVAISETNFIKIFEKNIIIREIDINMDQIIDLKLALDSKGLLFGYVADSKTIKTWKTTYNYKEKCFENCPKRTFAKEFDCLPCKENCQDCPNSLICLKCVKDFYLDDGVCVKKCGLFKSEHEDGTCQQRMVSFSFVFFGALLFIGMEIVRKFWKQIRSYIQKVNRFSGN